MTTAADMVDAGERSGAWPTSVDLVPLEYQGMPAPVHGTLATYRNHPQRILGGVGDRYHATTPARWRGLVEAACAAGAKPDGAFSLCGGRKILATFNVGELDGVQTNLLIADSFDGSQRLCVGFTTVRVVCANTLAAAFMSDSEFMAKLRHTATLDTKIAALTDAIGEAIKRGGTIAARYAEAEQVRLTPAQQRRAFDILFPPAPEDAPKATITKAETARADAIAAAQMPINKVGTGTLATLWNAATYLVDRNADGSARKCRGDADRLDSMLFGARAERIAQIQELVEVIMADGTVERMTVPAAMDHGIGADQITRQIMTDLGLGPA